MVSTYSDRLRFEKQEVGSNNNTWGTILNTNVIELIDEAIGGYTIVSVSSTGVVLSSNNGATDQARQASLEFAGTLTANVTITIPQEEKTYFLRNSSTGSFAVTMKTAAGTAVTVPQSSNVFVACNGTEIYKIETATSVASFTANNLTVVSTASVTEIDASIGSFSGPVSVNGALNVVGFVSGTNAVFTSTVSASNIVVTSIEASVGKFTNIFVSGTASLSNLTVSGTVSATAIYAYGYPVANAYALLKDVKTTGTAGGAATGATWNTRDLNTKTEDESNITSITSNQFALQAGKYYIRGVAPGYAIQGISTRIRNITVGSTALSGDSGYTGVAATTKQFVVGTVSIATSTNFELQMWAEVGQASGFGPASNLTGQPETYSVVEIWRLK